MRWGGIDQQRGGGGPMRQPLDLHTIINNRSGQEGSFAGQDELQGRTIPWFLKFNVIADRERCTHDEVKRVRGSCCNENILRGTGKAARSSKVGCKLCSQRRVPICGVITVGWQTSSYRSPRLAPDTGGKGRDRRYPQSKRDSLRGNGLFTRQWRSLPEPARRSVRRRARQTWKRGKILSDIGSRSVPSLQIPFGKELIIGRTRDRT